VYHNYSVKYFKSGGGIWKLISEIKNKLINQSDCSFQPDILLKYKKKLQIFHGKII
jgi:hypothetical protein